MAKQGDKKPWQSFSVWLSIFLLAILAIYVFSFYKINEQCEKQFNFNKEIKNESTQVTNPLIELKPDTTNKIFYLNEKDISELNKHIEYLTKKLETEVDRNQRNAEYNIDRLNLFMALGIGFLALIGGLLPLAVNFISKHDIESRLKEMEERVKESKVTVEAAKTKMPTVDLLILQSAVAKLTSKETLSLFLGDKQYADISNMIQRLVSAFKLFELENFSNYSEEQIIYINELLKELKLSLQYGTIRRSPSTSRAMHKKIDEIVKVLDKKQNRTIKEMPQLTRDLIQKLCELEKMFNELIPKTA